MRMVRNSQIWRAIPVLIAVCLVSLAVHSSQQRCCGGWSQAQYVGGTGEPDNPYLIFTGKQMNDVCTEPDNWDKHFRLMADIDLESYSYDTALIAPEKNTDESDLQGTPFTGVFDGNGYTISNLTISGKGFLGLFGRLESGAEIKNLGVVDVDIIGSDDNVGGLVGYNSGTLSNIYITGSVGGKNDIGGLVGNNSGGVVVNSTTIKSSNLLVDPFCVAAECVVDATGHSAELVHMVRKRAQDRERHDMGEGPMDAEQGERQVVEKTGEIYPNLYVAGMSVCSVYNLPRMWPIFGGMLASGKKVAELIVTRDRSSVIQEG